MKIQQLLDGIPTVINNQERAFIAAHPNHIPLTSLDSKEMWIAQNLVRKSVYKLTKDSKHIVINSEHENSRPTT